MPDHSTTFSENAPETLHGIAVRRSSRCRKISVRLYPDGRCEIIAPLAAPLRQLEAARQQALPWLEKHRQRLAGLPEEFRAHNFEFAVGKVFFYCGQAVTLQLQDDPRGGVIVLQNDLLLTPTADADRIRTMLEAFYRRKIRQIVTLLLEKYTQRFNITIGRVTVNGARSRFGSCSSSGNINFSWHLAMYPMELIELIVLHELAHRKVMNHSADFYKVLTGFLPDCRQRERLLKLWIGKLANYP